jgi:4-hydroxy-2-oxoheptanedioate aldolase
MSSDLQQLFGTEYRTPSRTGLKAEFEAEGARFDDLVVYSNIAHATATPLVIKIGGCEAVSDLQLAKLLGCSKVVAPMVESAFALRKFAGAATSVYGADRDQRPLMLFNIETERSALDHELLLDAAVDLGIDGVVVGRGDLAESMGLVRGGVEAPEVSDHLRRILAAARSRGLVCGFGGGVSTRTVPLALSLRDAGILDYFETRKVLLSPGPSADEESLRREVLVALQFELGWLEHKRDFYANIVGEDDARIQRLGSEIERG